jgi:hypothetical protein
MAADTIVTSLSATSAVATVGTMSVTPVVAVPSPVIVTPAAVVGAEFKIGQLSATPFVASNSVNSSDTIDTFSFSLSSAKDINLALTGMSGDADVQLYRDVNNNGVIDIGTDTLIGSSANGGNKDEAINVGPETAGNYLVQVSRFSGDTKYDLRLSATDNSTPSNLLPTEVEVGTLSSTQTFKGFVGDNNTADVYHFIAPQTTGTRNFTLSMTGLSADADVRLIHDINTNLAVDTSPSPSEVIGSSTRGGTSNESITASLTAGDNYFVEVYQYSGNTAYSLSLTV